MSEACFTERARPDNTTCAELRFLRSQVLRAAGDERRGDPSAELREAAEHRVALYGQLTRWCHDQHAPDVRRGGGGRILIHVCCWRRRRSLGAR